MNWFFIALLAPFLWSVSNHIDKYLLSKFVKFSGVGSLMIFSSLIVLLLLPIILIIEPNIFNTTIIEIMILIFGGFISATAILLYLLSLNKNEASIVAPFFQLIPIFLYFFGYIFLGETINTIQIIAGILIIIGALILSIDIKNGKYYSFKMNLVFLMILSSILIALYETLFKFVAIDRGFWVSNFWQYIGLLLFGIFLILFSRNYREEFISMMRKNGFKILTLNLANEIIYISGNLAILFAYLLVPIALAGLVNSYQPVFVFLIGLILTWFFPNISSENIEKDNLFQKILAILVIFTGSVLLHI